MAIPTIVNGTVSHFTAAAAAHTHTHTHAHAHTHTHTHTGTYTIVTGTHVGSTTWGMVALISTEITHKQNSLQRNIVRCSEQIAGTNSGSRLHLVEAHKMHQMPQVHLNGNFVCTNS